MPETRTYTGGFGGCAGLTLDTSQNMLVPSKEEGAEPVPVRRVVYYAS
jgi:hypothetical protein